ncbi:hypothetical protein [Desulfosporosinus sp. Sb-LF]|uniref:hypothetical protein n=1 Tax=Desulfosporosinus sp. Sb-LF TaxID=2560027 RepID=UPI001305425F|nr:hypothetical protein [Desulfosporosinus sp. Sb-LF]
MLRRKETQRDLSMDGLMPRCQGWQGAAHLQNSPRVLRFSLSIKRIAMQRVRTG